MPFPFALARLGAKPLEPFGKGSNALKAGTPDAGPESPTAWKPRGRPFSPRPGTSGKAALYALAPRKCKADARPLRLGRGLDNFGKPNRELGAFTDSVVVLAIGSIGLSGPFQTVEQNFHAVA